jgi:uncharacterized membrane protein
MAAFGWIPAIQRAILRRSKPSVRFHPMQTFNSLENAEIEGLLTVMRGLPYQYNWRAAQMLPALVALITLRWMSDQVEDREPGRINLVI